MSKNYCSKYGYEPCPLNNLQCSAPKCFLKSDLGQGKKMDEITKNKVKIQLTETSEIFELPELENMVVQVAKLAYKFYTILIEQGMSPDNAAIVTASYSGNIGKMD